MARVRYARSLRDLEDATNARRGTNAADVRLLWCRYETDAEAIAAVVPRPLEAQPASEVEVVVAETEGARGVRRAAMIGARVDYDGTPGVMPVVMPCDDETAVARGRERFGEPRKRAVIGFDGDGAHPSASITRHDVTFLRVAGARDDALELVERTGTSFTFKAFAAADPAKDFDHDPQLVRSDWRFAPRAAWRLRGGIELWESVFDPIADLPVRRLVGMEYAEGRLARDARVLRPVPGEWLRPFLHQRDDAPETEGVDV